jgi:tetratricopeptide (TPR) repeat protein
MVLLLLPACKTTKRKGDLSRLGKFYHNTTAEYNGYFNADVLMFESILELETQHSDNYNAILPLYKYRAADNPKAVAEKLDKAIEKTSVVVALHRYSDWTDDCYLLIGQAQYLKQDFEAAEETLKYMIGEFKPSSVKAKASSSKQTSVKKKSSTKKKKASKKKKSSKKKKKKSSKKKSSQKKSAPSSTPKAKTPAAAPNEKIEPGVTVISLGDNNVEVESGNPESYFLRHRPAYQEGLLWLSRTYIEREKYFEAERIIYQLTKSAGTFKDVRRDLAVVEAYYYLKQKKYADAIAPLERGIDLTRNRLLKARYTFVLGQLYQKLNDNNQAMRSYEQVVKYKPSYDMDFRARLNMNKLSWASSRGSFDSARRELERMLKDIKNVDFKDQIYFALAEIDLEEGKKDKAIENLRLSLANSSGAGASQKTESYLLLANLYLEGEKYVETKKYLDSTLLFMTQNDERFPQVSAMAANLIDIAKNLETIQLQDSLLALSGLSAEEQTALAAEWKKQQDEARRKALLASAQKAGPSPAGVSAGAPPPRAGAGIVKSDFFAYDDRSVKRGQREFDKKWGGRALEDNWRRSTQSSGGGFDLEEGPVQEVLPSAALTDEDVKAFFRDVPKTDEEVEAANMKIMDALFSLGRLYREKLDNAPKSIGAMEELLRRYPDTKYKPEAYYLLYLAYNDQGKVAEAKRYYDLLTSEFPDSPYAMLLTDPDFLRKTRDREQQINQYYDKVLAVFQQGKYQDAYEQINRAPAMFGGANSHTPRFELLKAMCLGNLEGKTAYVAALKEVIERFPTAPEQKHARELLRLLGEFAPTSAVSTPLLPEEQTYAYEPEDKHYIIVVLKSNDALEKAKVQLSDFHLKYFKLDKLRVSNIVLGDIDNRTPIVVVRSFDNLVKSMEYVKAVQANKSDFLSKEFQYDVYSISQNNYRQLLKNKVIDGYPEFYQKNY